LKILVTGGAGFIGRHLVQMLVDDGQVVVFDNLSNSSEELLRSVSGEFSFVKGDITNYDQISSVVSGVDFVIHLAAKISVIDSVKDPEKTKRNNVYGTENLLKACVANNVKNFIAASSASVYGDLQTPDISLDEKSKTNPFSPYGQSKLEMENLIKQFSIDHELNTTILRIFNIYGKGQSSEYAGVITKFAQNIWDNESLLIYGDGLQTRDFISIVDVVDSIKLTMAKVSGKRGTIYNIASGKTITIHDLAKLMLSISGITLKISNVETKKGDIKYSKASIELAKSQLGFEPKIRLEDGIKNLLGIK